MFGFFRVYPPELKVKEYEFYRGVYCGLCRKMSQTTTVASSCTLSYDMVFFALVRMALTNAEIRADRRRCAVHPLKKRPFVYSDDELGYTAAVSGMLTYYQLEDDRHDEKGLRRLAASTVLPYARRMKKKAATDCLDGFIKEKLGLISRLEEEQCAVPDEVAQVFGELLSYLLSYGLDGEEKLIAEQAGLAVGRFVYLADALCDYEQDAAKHRYNPYHGEGFDRQTAEAAAFSELDRAAAALRLIDYKEKDYLKSCVENVLTFGAADSYSRKREKIEGRAGHKHDGSV